MNRFAASKTVRNSEVHAAPAAFKLVGARVALDGHLATPAEMVIAAGRIGQIVCSASDSEHGMPVASNQCCLTVDLSGYLILPGLVNAHDHLEFNLLPRLGKGPYPNSVGWAEEIHRPKTSPLRDHLSVPKTVRLWWGGLKNLLSGVTTVCHHNPYNNEVFGDEFPVRVVSHYAWAHSLQFEEDLTGAHRAAATDAPFVIHAAEGTDPASHEEIFEIDRMGILDSRTVIVHGVGLPLEGRALLEQRGGGLVWCPTSNIFILGKTLSREELNQHRRVALGSDSALTADGDLLDEIRAAHQLTRMSVDKLFDMVTIGASDLLRLQRGEGTIQLRGPADLIAVPDLGGSPAETLVRLRHSDIEFTLVDGRVQLLSPRLLERWPCEEAQALEKVIVEGTIRYVRAPIQRLVRETRKHLGSEIRIAGKKVWS